MASRRNVPSEKTLTEAQGGPPVTSRPPSDTSPAVPASVIYKLLFFTVAMVAFPIGSYFFSIDLLFSGNATYAGAFAAIIANVVLVGYIIVAWSEDQSESIEAEARERRKKGQ